MSDDFKIELDHFNNQVARVKELTNQLQQAESALQSKLHGTWRCWGDDDPGSAFEGCYGPQTTSMSNNSSAASGRLTRFEETLDAAGKQFREHEEDNTSEILREGRGR